MPKRQRTHFGPAPRAKKARKQERPRQAEADSTPSSSTRKRARSEHVESPAEIPTIDATAYGSPSTPPSHEVAPHGWSAASSAQSSAPAPADQPTQHRMPGDFIPPPRKRARLFSRGRASEGPPNVRRGPPPKQMWDLLPLDVIDIITSQLSLRDMMSLCQFFRTCNVTVPASRLWATAERRVRAFASALKPDDAVALEKKVRALGNAATKAGDADSGTYADLPTVCDGLFIGLGRLILSGRVVSMLRNKKRIDVTRLDAQVLSTVERDLPAVSKLTIAPRPAGTTLRALQVSPALAMIPKLRVLNLGGCGLRRLPGAVTTLVGLQELDVGGNRLSWLPEGIGRELPQLRYCAIAGNPLGQPPASLLATIFGNFSELVGRGQRAGLVVDGREQSPVTDDYLKRTITRYCAAGKDRGSLMFPFIFDREGNPRPVWHLVFHNDDILDVDFIEMGGLPPEVNIM